MLLETSSVPSAARWTLRAISLVAAPCSSTALAVDVAIWLISRMTVSMPLMAVAASLVSLWIDEIWAAMSSVARAVWEASV